MFKREKGQAFTWDVVLATSVFMVVLGILLYQWSSQISTLLSSNEENQVSWLSTAAGEQLVRTAGTPIDWNTGSAAPNNIIFGLASYQRVGSTTTSIDRVLDPDKVFMYINASQNYTWMRYKMLGSGLYDYYAQLSCLNDEGIDCFNGLPLGLKKEALTNCTNNVSFYSSEKGLLYAVYDSKSLAGAWRFSEGSGLFVADSSGNMNSCFSEWYTSEFDVIGSSPWTSGKTRNAYNFTNYPVFCCPNPDFMCNPSKSLNLTGNMTIMAWIKPNLASGNQMDIVSKGNKTTGYEFGLNATTKELIFRVNPDSSHWSYIASSGVNLAEDTWQHVAVTYNGSGSSYTVTFYKDGMRISSTPAIGPNYPVPKYAIGDVFWIGAYSTTQHILGQHSLGIYSQFNGSMQDIRIYNRTLTEREISEISNISTQYCLLGNMSTPLNDTSYIAYDTKTFTFSKTTQMNFTGSSYTTTVIPNPLILQDAQKFNQTGKLIFAVYKQKTKSN